MRYTSYDRPLRTPYDRGPRASSGAVLQGSDRSVVAVMAAVLLATFTLLPLTVERGFVGLSALLILVLGGLTAGLRRAQLGVGLTVGIQLVTLASFSLLVSLTMSGVGEAWPVHYRSLWAAGIQHMQTSASPMDPNDGVRLIFVTAIGAIWVVTDLLVSGIRRPAWAIAPLAAMFLVTALGLGTDTGIGSFLCVGGGYLAILVAEGLNSTARWTRGLSRDSEGRMGNATSVVWRAAGYLAGPAALATVVLAAALPTLSLSGFGSGPGGGNGPLQLTDPTLDLKRNLTEPDNKEVIDYQTSQPGGLYLRLASLPAFSGAGWGNVRIGLTNGAALPEVPGLASESWPRRHTTIRVLDFGSQYLPLPYAPRSYRASGDWHYDPNSLTVVDNTKNPDVLRNLSYSVDSLDIAPSSADLNSAGVGTPSDASITAAVPRDLPPSLIDLSRKVTAGATTPAQKAAAIQAYLRSDRFTYSTQHLPGNGYQALENFLLRDHTGYCEQFASSMAMMARVVGIPSRVSVGFLPGERDGDSWRVSIRDMHAWPELYFASYGWVRFEPTPASVTGSAPSWTIPTQTSTTQPSADPSSSVPVSKPTAKAEPSSAPTQTTAASQRRTGFPWGRTLLESGGALVALLILAAPATIRVRRRTTRLAPNGEPADQVEAAWAEIRDTVVDHGGSWPVGSPQTIGRQVAARLDREESESMGRVATLVERSRYAPTLGADTTTGLAETTQTIRRGIAGTRSPRTKLLAVLLPRSVFRRRGR